MICVPEKMQIDEDDSDNEEEEEEELTILPSQIMGITVDILKNRNLIIFLVFLAITFSASSIE